MKIRTDRLILSF